MSIGEKSRMIIFILLSYTSSAYAQISHNEINPDYIKWLEGKHETVTSDGHALGYIPHPYQINTELPEHLKAQLLPKETLPASFDLRSTGGLTPVKDQGNCGSCWTFATMGAIESRWIVNGRGTYDLSEDNLNTCHPPFVWAPCEGGNSFISIAYLARGSGPKSESDDPYSDGHTTVDCPYGLTPQGIVTSGWFIPGTDPDLIKSIIQTYGALYTNMYYNNLYYNSSNHTYYYSGSTSTNHAVTLVGWDDNKVTAGGTGAWIIKNSWGTSWGESGYFYIAYQDSKVNSELTLFKDYINYNPNETISTYSESGWVNDVGYSSNQADGLVKFIASGNIELTKIGIWANDPGVVVNIEIYDNFNGTNSLTGLLGSISNQTCTYAGYYTFNLSSPISISNGNDYYVKISYQTTGYGYPIPVEEFYSGYTNPIIEKGKCWVKSSGTTTWTSLDSYDWDLCIYAYSSTTLLENDIAVSGLVYPSDGGSVEFATPFIPSASFQNVGSLAQTDVSVRYYIGDSVWSLVYSNTRIIANINSGQTITVEFDTVSGGVPAGNYRMGAMVVTHDQNSINDTLFGSFMASSTLSGTYTIGTGGNYTTISAAVADLNLRGVSGPVQFLLNDATYPSETFPIIINITSDSVTTSSKTVTFKPNTGITSTISGSSSSGAIFKIFNTNYITINGSNTTAGTSRDLTIANTSTTSPIVIWFGSNGSTPITNGILKNCIIRNGSASSSAVVISDGAVSGNAGYFSDIMIQNNCIEKAYIGVFANGGTLPQHGLNLYYLSNTLNTSGTNAVRYIGLYIQGVNGVTVSGNDIGSFNGADGEDDKGIWLATGTINAIIEQNNIHNLAYTGTGGWGNHGIYVSSTITNANIIIKNNVIAALSGDGYSYTSFPLDNPIGIALVGVQTDIGVFFNSINLTGNTLNKTSAMSMGIYLGSGSVADIRNNLIVNNLGLLSSTGYGSVGIYAVTNSAQFSNIDYNDYYVNPSSSGIKAIGQIASAASTSLSGWRTATGQDANSKNFLPDFTSTTDLHINLSTVNLNYIGIPISGITTDYDGDIRDANYPYIGADEIELPLPVELTCLRATTNHLNAELQWRTETEENNYGFEVERRQIGDVGLEIGNSNPKSQNTNPQWLKVGFVTGAGTSNSSHEYTFSDQNLSAGRYAYRIRQIDNDGSFKYSSSVEVDIEKVPNVPTVFSLEQNYPNPFNPSTTIRFGLPTRSMVKLEIFNILGQTVAKLVDGEKEAGFIEANWHANVASGLYIYRLEAVSTENSNSRFIDVKKMMLLR